MNSYLENSIGYITIIIFIGLIGAIIGLVTFYFNKPNIFKWDPNSTDEDKIERTSDRGLIISNVLFISTVFQALMKNSGAARMPLLLYYGFFLALVFGFMGDQGFGTDEGYGYYKIGQKIDDNASSSKKTLNGISSVIKFMLGKLVSKEFMRYIITVFIDIFISMPIMAIIGIVTIPFQNKLTLIASKSNIVVKKILNMLVFQFDNILQSVIFVATFLLYTNETRFRWAYPSNDILEQNLIPSSTIKLSLAISAAIYVVCNIPNVEGLKGKSNMIPGMPLVDRLSTKLLFVVVIFSVTAYCIGFTDVFSRDDIAKYKIKYEDYKYKGFFESRNDFDNNNNKIKKILKDDYLNGKEPTEKQIKEFKDKYNNDIIKPGKVYYIKTDNKSSPALKTKYNYYSDWKMGLGLFFIYLLIGFGLPFLPVNFIYDKHEEANKSWWKFGGFILLCIIITGATLGICLATPDPSETDLTNIENRIIH
jgi:uncharacterized membrane protein